MCKLYTEIPRSAPTGLLVYSLDTFYKITNKKLIIFSIDKFHDIY